MESFLATFLVAGQDALTLIGRAVLPVLFPFFVITGLILNLSNSTNPFIITTLSYFSGYPNGNRLTKQLYDQRKITVSQARHLAIITSTPSPIFVIATVGTVFLRNTMLGVVIFLCSILGAMLNGCLWRPNFFPAHQKIFASRPPKSPDLFTAFNQALSNSTGAIINVCGSILFFFILARLLNLPPFLSGILEMTTGTAQTTNPLLIEFFICFGGLSIAVQNLMFASSFQTKFRYYCAYKLTHAILSCGLLSIYLLFF